ncbi:hypothetical protein BDZ85DRAFT_222362, partial [Elsinoe ampelina]
MEHFAPHPGSGFEGYYSKFDLPSGGRIALIICTVPKAEKRPHKVSFTYVPKSTKEHGYFQRFIWPDEMSMHRTGDGTSFTLEAPGIGHMTVANNSITSYSIRHEDFTFSGKTTTHVPWSTSTDTPEGPLVYLPLPLHWHVHSLGSLCSYNLSIPSYPHLANEDKSGTATVHQEKNWANSFPSAHIWVQARSSTPSPSPSSSPNPHASLCIAGGQILGTEAYLLGYRSTTHPSCTPSHPVYELDFRPPLAMRLLGLSPSLSAVPNWEKRTFTLSARNWCTRIDVHATADEGTFFPLASPFPESHRDNFLAQSFSAEISVGVYEWVWGERWWDLRGEEKRFEGGSLEFGGGYY